MNTTKCPRRTPPGALLRSRGASRAVMRLPLAFSGALGPISARVGGLTTMETIASASSPTKIKNG
eukprot:9344676-Pyramimonas_sp.AAC.1